MGNAPCLLRPRREKLIFAQDAGGTEPGSYTVQSRRPCDDVARIVELVASEDEHDTGRLDAGAKPLELEGRTSGMEEDEAGPELAEIGGG
jgi:hypothetical protein